MHPHTSTQFHLRRHWSLLGSSFASLLSREIARQPKGAGLTSLFAQTIPRSLSCYSPQHVEAVQSRAQPRKWTPTHVLSHRNKKMLLLIAGWVERHLILSLISS